MIVIIANTTYTAANANSARTHLASPRVVGRRVVAEEATSQRLLLEPLLEPQAGLRVHLLVFHQILHHRVRGHLTDRTTP
jgi:hypothetical protein